jgi:hypothetical protein
MNPILIQNAKGRTIFAIMPDGRLFDEGRQVCVVAPRGFTDGWAKGFGSIPRRCLPPDDRLELQSVSRSLDGRDIATFRVREIGDYIRWIGKDDVGSWDLWRTAGTKLDKAYTTGE